MPSICVYHNYICEKKEFLGMTNHLLFVAQKQVNGSLGQ